MLVSHYHLFLPHTFHAREISVTDTIIQIMNSTNITNVLNTTYTLNTTNVTNNTTHPTNATYNNPIIVQYFYTKPICNTVCQSTGGAFLLFLCLCTAFVCVICCVCCNRRKTKSRKMPLRTAVV